MRHLAVFIIAPLALAGCMPTEDAASGFQASALQGQSPLIASTFIPPARPPLPRPRPDFEGITPASRSLGALVADAEEVDRKLEQEEAAAPPKSAAAQSAALASAGAATSYAPASAVAAPSPASPGYYAAYDSTVVSCFPQNLRESLNLIADHYGKAVEVTSGLRDHGRRHSLHRSCSAADIRVAGVGPRELALFARTVDGVNGVGTYRYNDVTHVDVRQEKMAWRY